jgi:nickel-dependent lactate racemase
VELAKSRLMTLKYGANGCFTCERDANRIVETHSAPVPNPDFSAELEETLNAPLDFPPVEQTVLPDDHITLALDRDTPEAASLLAAVWNIFAKRDVQPENVLIIQPPNTTGAKYVDPRGKLPKSVRDSIEWKIHDPAAKNACRYLAATSSGERIYLARDVVDADLVVSIGHMAFDPIMGFRGTNSVFFPGLSSEDAAHRARGQGHRELRPDDDRPIRQVIDEIGWLLGTQFSIQVTPSAGGGVSHVLAGAMDSVYRHGKQLLAEDWLVQLEFRADIVVAAVEEDAGGHGWKQIGAALAAARNLVVKDGKIVILSELQADLGEGMELIRNSETPGDAIGPLRKVSPSDLTPATQLAAAADWADVYLLSKLGRDLVEELFAVPLESESEVTRLLENTGQCAFLASAQHTFGLIDSV